MFNYIRETTDNPNVCQNIYKHAFASDLLNRYYKKVRLNVEKSVCCDIFQTSHTLFLSCSPTINKTVHFHNSHAHYRIIVENFALRHCIYKFHFRFPLKGALPFHNQQCHFYQYIQLQSNLSYGFLYSGNNNSDRHCFSNQRKARGSTFNVISKVLLVYICIF